MHAIGYNNVRCPNEYLLTDVSRVVLYFIICSLLFEGLPKIQILFSYIVIGKQIEFGPDHFCLNQNIGQRILQHFNGKFKYQEPYYNFGKYYFILKKNLYSIIRLYLFSVIFYTRSHLFRFCPKWNQMISIPYRMEIQSYSQIGQLNFSNKLCPACPTWKSRQGRLGRACWRN